MVSGSLFDSGAQTLANPVNCAGVMGAGLAREFARRYPAMMAEYRRACASRLLAPGRPLLWRPDAGQQAFEIGPQDPWILQFPTKDDWRGPSRLADIDAGLAFVASHASRWGVTSLALPALGCGLGGLPFGRVQELVRRRLGGAGFPVLLHRPS